MVDREKPRASYDDDAPFLPALTVYEDAPEPIDTGLVDINGRKLMRSPQRQPIGFDFGGKR